MASEFADNDRFSSDLEETEENGVIIVSPEYFVHFNPVPKNIPINDADFLPENDLNHESNNDLLMYLVFCFILARDAGSLHLMLQDIRSGIHCDINLNGVQYFEKSICGGILEKETFKEFLDTYMCSSYLKGFKYNLQDRLSDFDLIEDEFVFDERENIINLLQLACLTNDFGLIEIMTDNIWEIDEKAFHSILCHENVNEQVLEYLITRGTWFVMYDTDYENYDMFVFRCLDVLIQLCIMANDETRVCLLNKVKTIIRIFGCENLGSDGIIQCLERPVQKHASALLRFLLDEPAFFGTLSHDKKTNRLWTSSKHRYSISSVLYYSCTLYKIY